MRSIIPDHAASTPRFDILSHSNPVPSGVAGWFPLPLQTIPKRKIVHFPFGAFQTRFPSESINFDTSIIEFPPMGIIPDGTGRRGIVPHLAKVFKSMSGILTDEESDIP